MTDDLQERAREVLARWKAALDAQTNADFLTSYTIGAEELRALVDLATPRPVETGEIVGRLTFLLSKYEGEDFDGDVFQAMLDARDALVASPTPEPSGAVVEALRASLSGAAIKVLLHERFDPNGWEPPSPKSPVIDELVEQGLFRRFDARCGFEVMKDAWIKPTAAGLLARTALASLDAGSASS